MHVKALKFSRRTLKVLVEAAIVLGVLLMIACTLLVWRLTSGPMEINFAERLVQDMLRDNGRGLNVDMESVYLHWPDLHGPILLGLRGGTLFGANEREMLSIERASVGISKGALAIGRVKPVSLTLYDVSLKALRTGPYDFDLGLGEFTSSDTLESEQSLVDRLFAVMARSEGEEAGGALSSFERLEIRNASMVIDDEVIEKSWIVPRADFVFERAAGGLKAQVEVQFPSQKAEPPRLQIVAALDQATREVQLEAALERFSPALLAEKFPDFAMLENHEGNLSGRMQALLGDDMTLQNADLALIARQGAINHPKLSPEPIDFSNFGLLASYDAQAGALELSEMQLTIGDVTLEAEAQLEVTPTRDAVSGPVRLEIEELAHAAIPPLWPAALKGDNSEEWVVEKLSNGTFTDLFAHGRLALAKDEAGEWDGAVEKLKAGFSFTDMDIKYKTTMMPATDASGTGSFDMDSQRLLIEIGQADIADMKVSDARLEFVDIVKKGAGTADIDLQMSGPLPTLLRYIQDDPLNVKTDFDPAKAKGSVSAHVNLQFPTVDDIPKEAVKVAVEGTLSGVDVPGVVKGLPITAETIDLKIADGKLVLSGKGALDGRAADMSYEEFLFSEGKAYSSRVKASLRADEDLRRKFGIDLSEFLSGSAWVNVTYTRYNGNRSEADITADLSAARLYFEPFDYVKAEGAQAQAKLRAVLRDEVLKEIKDLTGSAPNFSLEKSSLSFRGAGDDTALAGGAISRFVLGETVAKLDFEVAQNGLLKLVLSGPFLDARPFLGGEKDDGGEYDGPPLQISVSADRMRTADQETVQYAKLYVEIDRMGKFDQLELDAIAGQGDVYLRYKPDQQGKRVFRFEADDAGATLRAFDLYRGMVGGKMVVYAEPIRSVYDRNLIGHAQITNFVIVDAPALARLLGVMSLPGLIQSLDGEGLAFTKMEADFDWLYRPQGSLLMLKDGRTSGNSLGLTFDGSFDNARHVLDVEGTIIPLSGVNKFIGSIPIIGDIITGGTGALIAATYTMEGHAEDPEIFVNPLSVLTPGLLRRILFEEGD